MKEDKASKEALEKQYFEESRGWEVSSSRQIKKSEKRAWIVAACASVVAVLAVAAVIALSPLKSVEPFVIRVDNATGIVEVVKGMEDGQTTYDETINKYWLSKYVKHRERYLPETTSYDRKVVGLMSDSSESMDYAELTDPQRNPKAPVNIYDKSTRIIVKIKNISFIDKEKSVALIRYTTTMERLGQKYIPNHWVATVPFIYKNASMSEENRLINPLGFQVTDYRNDPEIVQGN